MGNLIICEERPTLCPVRGVPPASAFIAALHIFHQMGWTIPRIAAPD